MKIPASTNHKPVIISENYGDVDGRFANNTDVKALSLGLTQWNGEGMANVAAKIWRNTEEQGSGQSEEIPIHRILDLSILFCSALTHFTEAYRYEHLYDPQNPVLDRIGLQGNAMTVAVCTDNNEINEDIKQFNEALSDNGEMIGERLRTLSRTLKEMGY
ncbi:hypothetical protein SAMN05661091_4505 [Paenibacillus uliginis N3/975]|uniref:Uncharacterized protein n=1 Tax=Paenibacillus uliginis N3/975 TaxID=1313296 RepID=A0A1X7HLY8_9BACL|nr:DUF6530 family protein [Paenibacillus uliginis]SMF89063.1 hypothetical protein SAMN05661091_4505 [Paenibacillus uliginis N3/975]